MENNRYSSEQICKVYKLINTINGKIYIGQTWADNVEDRMGKDGSFYKNSPYLYSAIQKYGSQNFKYEILFQSVNQQEIDEIETYYIGFLRSQDNKVGYNLRDGGYGGKHSDETKDKISKELTGRILPEETLLKMSESMKGKNTNPRTEEFKQAVSEKMKEWHENNDHPLLGISRTEEQKKAQSEKMSGRKHDPEVVKRRSQTKKENAAFTDEEEQLVIKLYLEEDYSFEKLSKHFKVNNRKIYRVFKKHNIQSKKSNSKKSNAVKWEEHNKFIENSIPQIIDMYNNYIAIDKIANTFNTSNTSNTRVKKILKDNNVILRAKTGVVPQFEKYQYEE